MTLEYIQRNRNNEEALKKALPIVHCSFNPTKYERLLITRLRNEACSLQEFRQATDLLGGIVVSKIIDCLPTHLLKVRTPIGECMGESLEGDVELLSIMRAGDALLNAFLSHFPEARISKILVQRDEETEELKMKKEREKIEMSRLAWNGKKDPSR